uniref:FLZ-type domain-containing protein n=1 Tax=Kalanchoe fedtschenkoi TaxID=63787 RepID=A0A7N0U8G7_KALFE
MVGLSVLLESTKNDIFLSGRRSMAPSPSPSPSSPSPFSSSSGFVVAGAEVRPFLHQCLLCKRRLLENEDIYMYMGEMAFCSEDCRVEYIAAEADGAGESGGRSTQCNTNGSSPAAPGHAIRKQPVFSADSSPPKHEGKRAYSSRIAC